MISIDHWTWLWIGALVTVKILKSHIIFKLAIACKIIHGRSFDKKKGLKLIAYFNFKAINILLKSLNCISHKSSIIMDIFDFKNPNNLFVLWVVLLILIGDWCYKMSVRNSIVLLKGIQSRLGLYMVAQMHPH